MIPPQVGAGLRTLTWQAGFTLHRQAEDRMKCDLYTDVALKCDVPEHRLRRGDIVKLVDHHMASDGTEGYSIEALRQDEVLCARTL